MTATTVMTIADMAKVMCQCAQPNAGHEPECAGAALEAWMLAHPGEVADMDAMIRLLASLPMEAFETMDKLNAAMRDRTTTSDRSNGQALIN